MAYIAWGSSFPNSAWGAGTWNKTAGGGTPIEAEGTHIWGHLVMYDRQIVRHFDIYPAGVAPGDDRDVA